jgi:hypothetical protein
LRGRKIFIEKKICKVDHKAEARKESGEPSGCMKWELTLEPPIKDRIAFLQSRKPQKQIALSTSQMRTMQASQNKPSKWL